MVYSILLLCMYVHVYTLQLKFELEAILLSGQVVSSQTQIIAPTCYGSLALYHSEL